MKRVWDRHSSDNSAGERRPVGIHLAAFGKHPGWDDHIEDQGLDTDALARLKSNLYIEGIGGNVDAGSWDRLAASQRIEGFGHVFLWRQAGEFIIGRLWSSRDGKGRTHYPMVVAVQCRGLPLAWALDQVLPCLEQVQSRCTQTASADEVVATLAAIRVELQKLADQFDAQTPATPADAEQMAAFLACPEWGPQRQGLVRVFYQMVRDLWAYRGDSASLPPSVQPSINVSMASAGFRPHHLRVPACGASAAEVFRRWSAFLDTELDPANPVVLMLPLAQSWLDILVGEPTAREWGCLRWSEEVAPLTTKVPYQYEADFEAWAQARIAALEHAVPRPADALAGRSAASKARFAAPSPAPKPRPLVSLGPLSVPAWTLWAAGAAIGLIVLAWLLLAPGRPTGQPPPVDRAVVDAAAEAWRSLCMACYEWFGLFYDGLAEQRRALYRRADPHLDALITLLEQAEARGVVFDPRRLADREGVSLPSLARSLPSHLQTRAATAQIREALGVLQEIERAVASPQSAFIQALGARAADYARRGWHKPAAWLAAQAVAPKPGPGLIEALDRLAAAAQTAGDIDRHWAALEQAAVRLKAAGDPVIAQFGSFLLAETRSDPGPATAEDFQRLGQRLEELGGIAQRLTAELAAGWDTGRIQKDLFIAQSDVHRQFKGTLDRQTLMAWLEEVKDYYTLVPDPRGQRKAWDDQVQDIAATIESIGRLDADRHRACAARLDRAKADIDELWTLAGIEKHKVRIAAGTQKAVQTLEAVRRETAGILRELILSGVFGQETWPTVYAAHRDWLGALLADRSPSRRTAWSRDAHLRTLLQDLDALDGLGLDLMAATTGPRTERLPGAVPEPPAHLTTVQGIDKTRRAQQLVARIRDALAGEAWPRAAQALAAAQAWEKRGWTSQARYLHRLVDSIRPQAQARVAVAIDQLLEAGETIDRLNGRWQTLAEIQATLAKCPDRILAAFGTFVDAQVKAAQAADGVQALADLEARLNAATAIGQELAAFLEKHGRAWRPDLFAQHSRVHRAFSGQADRPTFQAWLQEAPDYRSLAVDPRAGLDWSGRLTAVRSSAAWLAQEKVGQAPELGPKIDALAARIDALGRIDPIVGNEARLRQAVAEADKLLTTLEQDVAALVDRHAAALFDRMWQHWCDTYRGWFGRLLAELDVKRRESFRTDPHLAKLLDAIDQAERTSMPLDPRRLAGRPEADLDATIRNPPPEAKTRPVVAQLREAIGLAGRVQQALADWPAPARLLEQSRAFQEQGLTHLAVQLAAPVHALKAATTGSSSADAPSLVAAIEQVRQAHAGLESVAAAVADARRQRDGQLPAALQVDDKASPWQRRLAELAASRRAKELTAAVNAMTWKDGRLVAEADAATRWTQQKERFGAWIDGLARLLREGETVAARLVAWSGLDEKMPGDRSLREIRTAWAANPAFQSPEVQAAIEPLTAQVDGLSRIHAESDRGRLIAILTAPEPSGPLAWAAWGRLGQLDDPPWPATLAELQQEVAFQRILAALAERIADIGRRQQIEQARLTEARRRWSVCARQAIGTPQVEAVFSLRQSLGVVDQELDPRMRYNVLLHTFRKTDLVGLSETELMARLEGLAQSLSSLALDAEGKAVVDRLVRHLTELKATETAPRLAPVGAGPAAPDVDHRLRWSDAGDEEDGRVVVYKWKAHVLRFRRVEPAERPGKPAFLCTTEVPVGLFIEVFDAIEGWDEVRRRMPDWHKSTSADVRRGPCTWQVCSEGQRLTVSPAWLWTRRGDEAECYPPGRRPPPPQPEHPVQYVSPAAALYFARMLGCRLPTSAEWRWAYRQFLSENPAPRPWNLRDRAFAAQRDFVAARRAANATEPDYPDEQIFRPKDEPPAMLVADKAEAYPPSVCDDGILWFAKVDDDPSRLFKHLVGNVAEWVYDRPEQIEAPLSTGPAVRSGQEVAIPDPQALYVIGGSALSPPSLAYDQKHAVDLAKAHRKGYSDVGIRLAFSWPAGQLALRLQRLIEAQPYLKP